VLIFFDKIISKYTPDIYPKFANVLIAGASTNRNTVPRPSRPNAATEAAEKYAENHAKQIIKKVDNCPITDFGRERKHMPQFDFSLVVSSIDWDDDGFEYALFEAGCDDALVSFDKGFVVLDFTRQENNLAHAVATAIKDVESTGAKVVRRA